MLITQFQTARTNANITMNISCPIRNLKKIIQETLVQVPIYGPENF